MKSQDGYLTTKSGKWMGHFSRWVTDYSTGQRKRQQRAFVIGAVSGMTKTAARGKLRERMVKELGITADSRVTVAWFIEHRWKPQREGTWRESTKQTNNELLKIIVNRFGTVALEDMDGIAMQAWLTELAKKRSGSAVKHLRIFLRAIFLEAAEQDYVHKNPARLLRVPKVKAVTRICLTLPQVKALLKAATWYPRERALLRLILVTALRPSELFALKWKCFDMASGTLTIAETVYRGKIRPYTKTTEEGDTEHLTMHVPQAATVALAQWHSETERRAPADYIFPDSEGGFCHKENYQRRVLTPLAKQAGLDHLNFQILRRTVATHAQSLGSPKDISTILRHRKTETAQQHYIQAIEASVKETTEKLAGKMLSK
jgi:integrase